MTEDTGPRLDWRRWGTQSWSRVLFSYFFEAGAGDGHLVSRLAVNAEQLAKATGDTGAEPQAAVEAFLAAIRCTPSEFRRHLSSANLFESNWRGGDPPSCLAYLLFTCFAAASLDTQTINQGVFRERLRVLLGHPERTSYALTGLPLLWKAFESSLASRRLAGAPYRALALPDPGRMTLIGYSVRLAFPPREDRLQLVKLIREADWDVAPTVPEAIQLVSHRIGRFSSGFREVFARARRAFTAGGDAPELEALWSTILEVARLATAQDTDRSVRRLVTVRQNLLNPQAR